MCDVVGVVVCRFFLSLLISVGFAGAPPWGVSAPDLAMGTCSGVLPPRGRTLVRARAKVGCSGAAVPFLVAIRKCKVHFILGMNIRTFVIMADRDTFRGASFARGERYCASGRTSATCDGVPNASKGLGDSRSEGGEASSRPRCQGGQESGVARPRPSGASCARFLWGGSHIFLKKNIPGKGNSSIISQKSSKHLFNFSIFSRTCSLSSIH